MPCSVSADAAALDDRRRRAGVEVEHERRRALGRLGAARAACAVRSPRGSPATRASRGPRRAGSRSASSRSAASPCAPTPAGAPAPASGRRTCPSTPSGQRLTVSARPCRCASIDVRDSGVEIDHVALGEAAPADTAPCRGSTASARGLRPSSSPSWRPARDRQRVDALVRAGLRSALALRSPGVGVVGATSSRTTSLGRLVLAQALVGGVAQAAGAPSTRVNSISATSSRLAEAPPRAAAARRPLNGELSRSQRRQQLGQAVELCVGEARADAPGVAKARRPARTRRRAARRCAARAAPSPGSQPPITSSWRPTFLTFTQLVERAPGW